jgi:hypothetical protein
MNAHHADLARVLAQLLKKECRAGASTAELP